LTAQTLQNFRDRVQRCLDLAGKTADEKAAAALRAMAVDIQIEISRLEALTAGKTPMRRRNRKGGAVSSVEKDAPR